MPLIQEMAQAYISSPIEKIHHLKGDASARQIYRIQWDNETCIGVEGPNVLENKAFLGFSATFSKLGLPVPTVFYIEPEQRGYLLEDLGDQTLFQLLVEQREANRGTFPEETLLPYYTQAVEHLVEFQLRSAAHLDYSLCYQTDSFTHVAWQKDWEYFLEYFVHGLFPEVFPEDAFAREFYRLKILLEKNPAEWFLYRDFQSRNIMKTEKGLRFIDYQSGRRGAVSYDIASLLVDARADIPFDTREKLLACHSELIAAETALSKQFLEESYAPFALMRVLQALGSYGNNGIRRGHTEHIHSIPLGIRNALQLLDRDSELSTFQNLRTLFLKAIDEHPWEVYLQEGNK